MSLVGRVGSGGFVVGVFVIFCSVIKVDLGKV